MIKTRIAPSPTGLFHLGTARTAYHNYLKARANNGQFIVRIDDTDLNRNNEQFVDIIYSSLDWLGLDYNLTFRQSSRLDRYHLVANDLIKYGFAKLDDGCIRLSHNYLNAGQVWLDSTVGSIKISQQDVDLSSTVVLIKSDQQPTYHFASVVDDIDYEITHVIRGADHLSNTIKHLFIIDALKQLYPHINFPDFNHVGLITQNGKKISKRDPQSDLKFYQENYKSAAILNFILRLGWSHPDPLFDKIHPMVDRDLAIKVFNDGKFKFGNASLDLNKLNWLNKKYNN